MHSMLSTFEITKPSKKITKLAKDLSRKMTREVLVELKRKKKQEVAAAAELKKQQEKQIKKTKKTVRTN